MKPILLLDLDGTLTNNEKGITRSALYALSKYGITDTKKNLRKFIGPPLAVSFKEYYHFTDEQANEAIRFYRERYSKVGLFENKVYRGIKTTLRTLNKMGYTLCLCTSKPENFSKMICDKFGLSKYLVDVVGETNEFGGKKAIIVKKALDKLGIEPKDALMVGDRLHDIEAAHENGVLAVGVLWGFGSKEEFERYQADYVISKPKDLIKLVTKMKEGD